MRDELAALRTPLRAADAAPARVVERDAVAVDGTLRVHGSTSSPCPSLELSLELLQRLVLLGIQLRGAFSGGF